MTASQTAFDAALRELTHATATEPGPLELRARRTGLDTPLRAAEAASAALAAGAASAGAIAASRGHASGTATVDSRHAEASLISFLYLNFQDDARGIPARINPEERTAASGFYQTADDRWVYLHAGFPHNTKGVLDLLGVPDDRSAVTRRIARLKGQALEDAIAAAGLCGAMVRSAAEWDQSAEGAQLAARPVVEIVQVGDSAPEPFPEDLARPLHGLKVLDLTRILAGPTCARTLASYGANVLRVGASHLPTVPLFAVDTGFGKRACDLDLRDQRDLTTLKRLIRASDVFSQGYRTGAMERHGLGVTEVARQRPGIVYVSINCYGHEAGWRTRPGWEQLAQTVTGMAHLQGKHLGLDTPTLLPAAVNDYITGYLAAAGALAALRRRATSGGSYWVRVSLARTAVWVRQLGLRRSVRVAPLTAAEIAGWRGQMETAWGTVDYLQPAVSLSNAEVGWQRPPSPLGSDRASFKA